MTCTPEQQEQCELRRCFVDRHHLYFPRADYSTPLEKTFRSLGQNIIELCRWAHIQLHKEQEPPPKPDQQTMAEIVLQSEAHLTRRTQDEIASVMQERGRLVNDYWRNK